MTLKDTTVPAASQPDIPSGGQRPAGDRPAGDRTTGERTGAERPGGVERSLRYRSFWRKLEATLGAIQARADVAATLDQIILVLLRDYRQDLHLVAGRLYEKVDADRYVLRRWHGDNTPAK